MNYNNDRSVLDGFEQEARRRLDKAGYSDLIGIERCVADDDAPVARIVLSPSSTRYLTILQGNVFPTPSWLSSADAGREALPVVSVGVAKGQIVGAIQGAVGRSQVADTVVVRVMLDKSGGVRVRRYTCELVAYGLTILVMIAFLVVLIYEFAAPAPLNAGSGAGAGSVGGGGAGNSGRRDHF